MPDLVYIADDEPNIRKLAALALKDSGFETQEFADGVSLMAAVRVRKPDAIVLDWMMPPPDGLAVCHKIRADESTRPIDFDAHRTGRGSRPGAGIGNGRG